MTLSKQVFQPGFDMSGIHLVAASAGTGKTYSIQTLYLRLLLLQQLTVRQILVVTFTNAATKELRERLQRVLRDALEHLEGCAGRTEARVVQLVDLARSEGASTEGLLHAVRQALLDFDLASIYTIHGFCQRMLHRFAFETGQAFDLEPLENSDAEIIRICRDWWRRHVYGADPERLALLEEQGISLSLLTEVVKRCIAKPDATLLPPGITREEWDEGGERLRKGKAGILNWAAESVARLYRESRPAGTTATFDDYLLNLRRALEAEGRQGPLHTALRTEFRAALIDEFQDTDPIQWGIFRDVFGEPEDVPCFLVGDPKQAIYRFRNGDIETYVRATGGIRASARHELTVNYRAEKRLIDAVNQVFIDRQRGEDRYTFKHAAIAYAKPLAAQGKPDEASLTVGGKVDARPFKLWVIPSRGGSRIPGKQSPTARMAYRITAAGIAHILNDPATRIGGRRVNPGQIAVLVRTHDEGSSIADALRRLSIPCVRQGTGNVWGSEEARQLWMLLQCVRSPGDLGFLRGTLLTPWIGFSVDDIVALNDGETVQVEFPGGPRGMAMQEWVAFFDRLRDVWNRRGYAAMFRKLAGSLGIRKRLAGMPDGIRKLANLFHLSELIHTAIVNQRMTPDGVLAWVRGQLEEPAGGGDEARIRMESDASAVRIMTVFTSKGLEFPIVFAPTLFMLQPGAARRVFEYHEPDGSLRMTCAEEGKVRDDEEMFVEHLRQIYVALTRAAHRTVVLALPFSAETENWPLGWLLGRGCTTGGASDEYFSPTDPGQCAIEVSDCNAVPAAVPYKQEIAPVDSFPDQPVIDVSRGHGSFTSLAPRSDLEPLPAGDARNRDGETAGEEGGEAETIRPSGIFAFPAGAKTGTCWHEILEEMPFDADDERIRSLADEKLRIYGFLAGEDQKRERLEATVGMLCKVLRSPLPPLPGAPCGFALKDIAGQDRINEWEFSFPSLSGRTTAELRAAISATPGYESVAGPAGAWNQPIPAGYLTGFIDLLFRKDGRYYVADWKSNRRGGQAADFGPAGLQEEMRTHGYWLQSLIYSVAVHQYLRGAMEAYDYERHFGGVYYVFLRGIDGKGAGVHAARPPKSLIDSFSAILGDFA